MLFGQLLFLKSPSGSIVFIAVLVFLLIFEGSLHAAEHLFTKHGYKGLIQKLYKEFMIMGFISFGTNVYLNAVNFEISENFFAFEFAHLVLFVVAIVFVLQGGLLVWLAVSRNKSLLKYASTSSIQLFAELKGLPYAGDVKNFFFHHGPLILPYPKLREKIEYKIIEEFFIQSYNLPPEFNFANYLRRMLKNYVISLVEVRPINWLFIAGLVALNYGRLRAPGGIYEDSACEQKQTYQHHENGPTGIFQQNESYIGGHQLKSFGGGGGGQQEGSSSGDSEANSHGALYTTCVEYLLSYALFNLLAVMAYQCVVLFFSELYMQRLLGKVIDREIQVEEQEKGQTEQNGSNHAIVDTSAVSISVATDGGVNDSVHSGSGPRPQISRQYGAQEGNGYRDLNGDENEADSQSRICRAISLQLRVESDSDDDDTTTAVSALAEEKSSDALSTLYSPTPASQWDLEHQKNNDRMESTLGDQQIEQGGEKSMSIEQRNVSRVDGSPTIPRSPTMGAAPGDFRRPGMSFRAGARGSNHEEGGAVKRDTWRGSLLATLAAPSDSGRRHMYMHCLDRINVAEITKHESASRRSSAMSVDGDATSTGSGNNDTQARSRTRSADGSVRSGRAGSDTSASALTVGRARSKSVSASVLRDRAIASVQSGAGAGEVNESRSPYNRSRRRSDNADNHQSQNLHGSEQRHPDSGPDERPLSRGRSYSVEFFEEHTNENVEIEPSAFEKALRELSSFVSYLSATSLVKGLQWVYGLLMEHPGDPKHSSDKAIERMQRDLATIFLFGDARAYFHAVEFGLMLQCFYTALWITNVAYIASKSHHPYMWSFILALPLIINSLILRQTVYFACMLKSVSNLDTSVSGEICEQALDTRNVTSRLRKLLRTQLHKLDIDKVEWHDYVQAQFFTFLPKRGRSKGLNFKEMLSFIHSLQIHLTTKSVRNQFKVIDFDKDGFVRWRDLELIVFPEVANLRKLKYMSRDPRLSLSGRNRELSAYSLADEGRTDGNRRADVNVDVTDGKDEEVVYRMHLPTDGGHDEGEEGSINEELDNIEDSSDSSSDYDSDEDGNDLESDVYAENDYNFRAVGSVASGVDDDDDGDDEDDNDDDADEAPLAMSSTEPQITSMDSYQNYVDI